MALKTEDDYQDEIDDLKKEIDRLYDEGTDKGFKLKREEQMEQELRALETEKDYQRELDRVEDEATKIELQIMDKEDEINKLKADIKKLQAKQDPLLDKANKLEAEAKKKGFKLKRGEKMDFETRKKEILANLEARALNTQKAYQKEIDKYNEKLKELQDDFDRYYTDAAIKKHLKSYLESMESQFLRAEEKGKQECLREIEKYKKIIDQLYKDAKDKGFKVNK